MSERLAARFANTGVNEKFRMAQHEMLVVGHLNAANTAFDSEIWMDWDETLSLFNRENYSSLLVKTTDPVSATNLISRIENDKTLSLKVVGERDFYKTQTSTGLAIQFVGSAL